MTQDAWLHMPPVPQEYQGRELVGPVLRHRGVPAGPPLPAGPDPGQRPARLRGPPPQPVNDVAHAFGLLVVTLTGDRISVITRFDNATMAHFGLPRILTN